MIKIKERTACFTGHRTIPFLQKRKIKKKTRQVLIDAIEQGYRYFGAGGALGFDTLAAQTVLGRSSLICFFIAVVLRTEEPPETRAPFLLLIIKRLLSGSIAIIQIDIFLQSNIFPSMVIVITCQGMNLPLACRALSAARWSPPQQGTCIRRMVTLLMSFRDMISPSFSA